LGCLGGRGGSNLIAQVVVIISGKMVGKKKARAPKKVSLLTIKKKKEPAREKLAEGKLLLQTASDKVRKAKTDVAGLKKKDN